MIPSSKPGLIKILLSKDEYLSLPLTAGPQVTSRTTTSGNLGDVNQTLMAVKCKEYRCQGSCPLYPLSRDKFDWLKATYFGDSAKTMIFYSCAKLSSDVGTAKDCRVMWRILQVNQPDFHESQKSTTKPDSLIWCPSWAKSKLENPISLQKISSGLKPSSVSGGREHCSPLQAVAASSPCTRATSILGLLSFVNGKTFHRNLYI
ncbi:hypothetical protein RRG08_022519 [Elysia crispata]|uniref:Uncharacterized protein n=1 Tax=Elysia crispata TaxID=231223 RepID=A0AAE1D8X8_9GAST|nr:hypothetical protein RRG08_022519 [Elysia crispata]